MKFEAIENLREREKELNCLYRVHEILKDEDSPLDEVFKKLLFEIPSGWQYSGICVAKINYRNSEISTPGFFPTQWVQEADILLEGKAEGKICVYYTKNITDDHSPFLPEEQQLLNTIAQQVSQHIFSRKLRDTVTYLQETSTENLAEDDNLLSLKSEEHWKWRKEMAETIAEKTDFAHYDIEAMYLIGSVKEATAGPASDLDIIVHFSGNDEKKKELKSYMEGWGLCLSQMNYMKTGYFLSQSMIDLHFVTTEEINNKKNSFGAMIGSHTNSARLLRKK